MGGLRAVPRRHGEGQCPITGGDGTGEDGWLQISCLETTGTFLPSAEGAAALLLLHGESACCWHSKQCSCGRGRTTNKEALQVRSAKAALQMPFLVKVEWVSQEGSSLCAAYLSPRGQPIGAPAGDSWVCPCCHCRIKIFHFQGWGCSTIVSFVAEKKVIFTCMEERLEPAVWWNFFCFIVSYTLHQNRGSPSSGRVLSPSRTFKLGLSSSLAQALQTFL